MVVRPTDATIPSFDQGINIHCTSPTCYFQVGNSSQPRLECEISYDQLPAIRPITHQFTKVVGLIPGVIILPYSPNKNKTTSIGIVVSSVEEVVLATLEELADSMEREEEPGYFIVVTEATSYCLGSTFFEIAKEEEEPLYLEKEEEDNKEEDMADQNLDRMTQDPLEFLGVLHKVPRHVEKLFMKYDLDKIVKVEEHLDNFYLHL